MKGNNVNLLCTRMLPASLLAKAFESGVAIEVLPFIYTAPIATKEIISDIKKLQSKNITAVFTSINALDAVAPHFSSKPQWDIYCMGGITKEAVISFFGADSIKGTARNAVNLAEKIIANNVKGEIIFFCSDHRLEKLPGILTSNGFDIKEMIVYNTIETPHLIEKEYDGIIFFSPSAVHSFFAENTISTDVILFSIGKTTAATIATYVMNEIVASEWPGQEQLIDQVIQYYSNVKH